MWKRYVTLAAMIGLVVLAPSVPARAARKRTYQCTTATRSANVQQDDGYPNVGTTAECLPGPPATITIRSSGRTHHGTSASAGRFRKRSGAIVAKRARFSLLKRPRRAVAEYRMVCSTLRF